MMMRSIVHYCGHVQGVGFRVRVSRLAQGLAVTGYVKNLPDGRVLLVAEGEATQVKRLLVGVAAELAENIQQADVQQAAATGEFREFTIRY